MIYSFDDFKEFAKKAKKLGIPGDLGELRDLDIIFHEVYDSYMILSLVAPKGPNRIVILSKDFSLIYPKTKIKPKKLKKAGVYAESTFVAYTVLDRMADRYIKHFEALNREIDEVDKKKFTFEAIEELSDRLKGFRDIADDFVLLLIKLEKKGVKFVQTMALPYSFDILVAEARHLADRCRSSRKEISVLRDKFDAIQMRNLNTTMERLTKVMTVLTVVTLIISIPNTIATVFGIPTFAQLIPWGDVLSMLVISSIIAIVISLFYWKIALKK